MAIAITIICLVVLLELQSLAADEDVKGPKVTEKVCGRVVIQRVSYRLCSVLQFDSRNLC